MLYKLIVSLRFVMVIHPVVYNSLYNNPLALAHLGVLSGGIFSYSD